VQVGSGGTPGAAHESEDGPSADLLADPLNLGTNPFAFSITVRVSRVF